jgi:hypothetical protein
MSNSFAQVRTSGKNADLYIRTGQQLLFRLREMKRTSGSPVIKRTVPVDENTTITVQIANEQEFIAITHTGDISEPAEEKVEEELEPTQGCPPAFVVNKHKQFDHTVLNLDAATHNGDGIITAPTDEGIWRVGTVANFEDAANAGWYGLQAIQPSLNNPDAHAGCDIITWYGNSNSACEDRVFSFGAINAGAPAFGRYPATLLAKVFFYKGERILAPDYVLGACILPSGSTDYYYILCTSHGAGGRYGSYPDARKGGSDETVYRKDVTADNHATNNWTLVHTIPYTDFSTYSKTNLWPLVLGTAYIDDEGVAFFTKLIADSATGAKERKQIEVDLRGATHSVALGDEKISTWYSDSWTYEAAGGGSYTWNEPPTPAPTLDSVISRSGGSAGEQYLYTMGGLEAKYDVFVKVAHEDSVSGGAVLYNVNLTSTGGPFPSYEWESSTRETIDKNQSTRVDVVLKKDGVQIWEGPLQTIEVDCSYENDAEGTSHSGTPEVINYGYIFLHPHALDKTTWYQQNVVYGPYEDDTTTVETGFYRDGDLIAGPWGDTFGPNVSDDTDFAFSLFRLSPAGDSDSEERNCYSDGGIENNRTPVAAGVAVSSGVVPGPITWGAGGVGVIAHGETSSTTLRGAFSGYSHAAERDNRPLTGSDEIYFPEFMAVQRPVATSGPWSYILSLQEITNENPDAGTISSHLGNYQNSAYSNLNGVLRGKVRESDAWAGTAPLAWVQCNATIRWVIFNSYVEGENVYYRPSTSSIASLWVCNSGHTATALNAPGMENAPWEKHDPKVEVFSNVISEAELKRLTGELYANPTELGIL